MSFSGFSLGWSYKHTSDVAGTADASQDEQRNVYIWSICCFESMYLKTINLLIAKSARSVYSSLLCLSRTNDQVSCNPGPGSTSAAAQYAELKEKKASVTRNGYINTILFFPLS